MNPFLAAGQLIVSVALTFSILLQSRGSGLGGTFGGDSAVYRSRRGIDTQVHPVLVQRGDQVGSHEPPASPGAHHDSVKDAFRGSGDDVVDVPTCSPPEA